MRRTGFGRPRAEVDELPDIDLIRVELVDIEGELPQMAALAGMALLQAGLIRRLVLPNGCFRDHDVLELIGVSAEEGCDAQHLRVCIEDAMSRQSSRLLACKHPLAERLDRNLAELGRLLSLTHAAQQVLRIAVLNHHMPGLADVLRLARRGCMDEFTRLVARAFSLNPKAVTAALGRNSPLRHAGLLDAISTGWDDAAAGLEVDSRVAEVLLDEHFDSSVLLNAVARPTPEPQLELEAFGHQRTEIATVIRYLKAAGAEQRAGVNVLLHGDPGVGKTELARLLARECGLKAHEVPAEDRDGDPIRGSHRLGAFMTCQRLLRDQPAHAIVFDEIEDVFPVSDVMAIHRSHGERAAPKRFVNDLLENSPVPSFWIANSIFQMDPAFIRRFDLVLEVRTLPRSERRRLLARALDGVRLPHGAIEAIAGIDRISPAQIDSAARVLRLVADEQPAENLARLKQIFCNALQAMGMSFRWPAMELGKTDYRLDWLNPSQPLQPIIDGISQGGQGRVCLYGPPGTGKTAFAHHLGEVIDRPVIATRASDLLSKWVGGTERNIAAAFARARDDGAILLIDEADSMLGGREGANQQWQVSQVNEMLTQMESFDGIFIASTNLADRLDEASLRRFDFKLRFDPPQVQQRRMMVWESYRRLFEPDASPGAMPDELHGAIDRLHGLCPGDVATALRQCRITRLTPDVTLWLELLEREVQAKRRGGGRSIGFV